MVFLWWCFSGGVVVWWCFGGDRWWCSCGGICVVVFRFGVVVFLWLCFCGGGGGVFEVCLCFCDGVVVCFFGQGSTFVALPRSYAKSVDNTGVKRCLV